MSLATLTDFIQQTSDESSTNGKIAIARRYEDIKDKLALLYDPLTTTGVTRSSILAYEKKHPRLGNPLTIPQTDDIWRCFHALADRKLTGHAALEEIARLLHALPDYRETLLRLFDKNLKNRMGVKAVNKAFSGLIREFRVALAVDFNKATKQFDPDRSRWFISRKFDGVRCVVILDNDSAHCCSRTGHPFPALRDMVTRLAHDLRDAGPLVLDGEVCCIGPTGAEDFQQAVSKVRRKNAVMIDYCFYVFDVLTPDEFFGSEPSRILSERMEIGQTLVDSCPEYVRFVRQTPYGPEMLLKLQAQADTEKWEGLMLRKDSPYQGKRSKDILKVKKFHSAEYVVEAVENAPMMLPDPETGKIREEETMGSAQIRHRDHVVHVGSGWSLAQRRQYYADPAALVGRTIEVQYFEETHNKQGGIALRFPTLRCVWGDKRDA